MNWCLEIIKESRGFVADRILNKALVIYMSVYGNSYWESYEKFTRIITHEDMYKIED